MPDAPTNSTLFVSGDLDRIRAWQVAQCGADSANEFTLAASVPPPPGHTAEWRRKHWGTPDDVLGPYPLEWELDGRTLSVNLHTSERHPGMWFVQMTWRWPDLEFSMFTGDENGAVRLDTEDGDVIESRVAITAEALQAYLDRIKPN